MGERRERHAHVKQMIKQSNSIYRYYWYYSSLSARRDGAVEGCLNMLNI
ncbi:MAG: hypothetical protein H0V27_13870 [Pyrinomonadaceae bacterium]|jgi:hypothetical protein|nr:hypothetical protein [Pyrinomonadaceae bacterium]MDQ3684866.1 hypothetical protein [Acidobacteriota bacterium]